MEMFHAAVRQALVEDHPDPGENAGEHFVTLAADRGLDLNRDHTNLYRCAVNHAAAADIIVTAARKGEAWRVPDPPNASWISSALMDPGGRQLRRFLAVSSWSDERAFYETRSWFSLGEVCQYRLPMQMVVAVLGVMNGGRRHGYWSKALLHPQHSSLRFRRRSRGSVEGFKETWIPVWREEHDEIDREKWLQGMLDDGVLQESLFVVNIPVPEESEVFKIQELGKRQVDRVSALKLLPEKQLTTCHDPLSPCPFRVCCWSQPESHPQDGGFDATA